MEDLQSTLSMLHECKNLLLDLEKKVSFFALFSLFSAISRFLFLERRLGTRLGDLFSAKISLFPVILSLTFSQIKRQYLNSVCGDNNLTLF